MRQLKPWMRPSERVPPPSPEDVLRVLGELIELCRKRRVYDPILRRAEFTFSRASVTKRRPAKQPRIIAGQGELL